MSRPMSPFCLRLFGLIVIALLVSIPSQLRQVGGVTKQFNSASSSGVLWDKVRDMDQWERPFSLENITYVSSHVHSHFMNPPGIVVMSHYKSNIHAHDYVSNSITLVSQMSVDKKRIQRHLLDMASRWSGYISLAVYVPPASAHGGGMGTVSSSVQAMKIIDDIRAKNSSLLRKVDFHLVFHDNQTDHATTRHLPHNYLRNIALHNAVTEYVMVLDADIIPSTGSHDILLEHFKTTKELREDELSVLVLPAFERKLPGIHGLVTRAMMADDLPPTKSDLLQRMKDFPGRLDQFHRYTMYTNHTGWYYASEPYPVDGYLDYEPFFVVRKTAALPPFWEPFTGYGSDMISWVEEMAVAGFNFFVSPDSFVYQIGHVDSNHDAKAIRHIADEYANEFQAYLKNVYGKSVWKGSSMALWNERQKSLYVEKTFRICKKEFVPLLGGNHTVHLGYQCNGNHYLDFAWEMQSLAAQFPEPVGRRAFPVASNLTALVMGNSHTRQMILSLLCQFNEEVIEFDTKMGFKSSRGDSFRVRFRNNSTIMSLTNNPVVYSPHWVTLVENIVGRPLGSFDAIVLGKFNSFKESKGTSFTETVTEALKNLPVAVDFSKSRAPTLPDIMTIYDGPVVYVSMFAAYGQSQFRDNEKVMKNARGTRDNISVIDGRKFIDILKMECGSDGFNMVGTCKEGEEGKDAHRCTGGKGGHPDLIAWDVAEILNKL